MKHRSHLISALGLLAFVATAAHAQQSPFGPIQPLLSAVVPQDLCIADMNGDGLNDLVYLDGDAIKLLLNQGGALPFTPFGVFVDVGFTDVTSVRAVDLDADGDLDLVAGSAVDLFNATGSIAYYENDGLGAFGPRSGEVSVDAVLAIETVDFDGDGDDDVVVAGAVSVAAAENDGSGALTNFRLAQVPRDPLTGLITGIALDVADIDGDGRDDLAVAVRNTNTVLWIRNEPFSELSGNPIFVSTTTDSPQSIRAVDQDGDGDLDLVVASAATETSGEVVSFQNNGHGAPWTTQSVDVFGTGGSSLARGDVDLDGRVDILSALKGPDRVRWYRNTGCFCTAPISVVDVGNPEVVALGDIDGDGADDLVVAGGTSLSTGTVLLGWHRNEQPDCNGNGVADGLDFASGALTDCDGNGIGDACELLGGTAFDLNGNGLLDRCEALGAPYCSPALPNSTGLPARIRAVGQDLVFFNSVLLVAEDLPQQQFGFFLVSSTQGASFPVPNSQGRICLAGDIGRFNLAGQIQSSGPDGRITLDVDITQLPIPTGLVSVVPFDTWSFQLWHRDVHPGPTSNFTDGVQITFR